MYDVVPLPAFNDNYIWLLRPDPSPRVFIVDPGDANPVLEYLQNHALELAGILITHHHADHIGGIEALLAHHNCPVYGPKSPHIPQISHPLEDGDEVTFTAGIKAQVIGVPGHTLDHIAYYIPDAEPFLFCGDTLFAAGCGRLFEGTPAQMYQSLSKLAALPMSTRVYCAHEYTLSNLRFAQAVEPDNQDIQSRMEACQQQREQNLPTLPTTLQLEHATNPFFRVREPSVISAVSSQSPVTEPVEVFAAIRHWKDNF